MDQRVERELGTFEVKSGRLIVSDPCYDRDVKCIVEGVANGTWDAAITLEYDSVAELSVAKVGSKITRDQVIEPVKFDVGVDSGQVCIVDEEVYPQGDPGEVDDLTTFYGRACQSTEIELGDIIENQRGVNVRSGDGDGTYEAFVARDKDDRIVALRVVFIEEDCGEEMSEDDTCLSCGGYSDGRDLCDDCRGPDEM